jgi:hypothetical protein
MKPATVILPKKLPKFISAETARKAVRNACHQLFKKRVTARKSVELAVVQGGRAGHLITFDYSWHPVSGHMVSKVQVRAAAKGEKLEEGTKFPKLLIYDPQAKPEPTAPAAVEPAAPETPGAEAENEDEDVTSEADQPE